MDNLPAVPPWLASPPPDVPDDEAIAWGEQDADAPARRWQIDSIRAAEWAMFRLAQATAAITAIEAQAAEWRTMISEWAADTERAPKRAVEFFGDHLERYALALRKADPKAATLRLPSGDVATRRAGTKVVVTDEDAVIAWAKEAFAAEPLRVASIVKVKESVLLTGLRDIAEVASVVIGYTVTFSDGAWQIVAPLDGADGSAGPDLAAVDLDRLGDIVAVEPVTDLVAYGTTSHGLRVAIPGVDVEAEHYTATVKPRPTAITTGETA